MSSSSKFYDLSERDNWKTPKWLLDAIEENHGLIHTDPSQGSSTSIGSLYNYNVDDNGLEQKWNGTVFVNPPFSYKSDFLEKAVEEVEKDYCDTIFFVTPDGTDTISWWHEYIAEKANYIWFSKGRISYVHPNGETADSPTFGTAVSVFGDTTEEMIEWFSSNGHLVKTVKP
jgi:phage N-6-adenine-methyltransferase